MYVIPLIGLLALATWLVASGQLSGRRARTWLGAGLAVGTVAFYAGLSLYAEALWFEAVGYATRFWRMIAARVGSTLLGASLAAAGLYLLLLPVRPRPAVLRRWPEVAAGAVGAVWGWNSWDEIVLYLHRVPTALQEPILGRTTSFYLFELPLYDRVFWLALGVIIGALAVAVAASGERRSAPPRLPPAPSSAFLLANAALGAVLAWGSALAAYHLLYSEWGVVTGPGWIDAHVRLPAYRLAGALALLAGLGALVPVVRRRVDSGFRGLLPGRALGLSGVAGIWISAATIAALALLALPAAVQWLAVTPNEISFERPFIAENIRFTRHGFGLHRVEERQFPASEQFTRAMVHDSRDVLAEARLWDMRALDAVYKQFQEIRLYYEFADVDVDRYQLGDRYRQVMVSARELYQDNLPRQSQTFVNQRFKYTHGYGATVATVRDFTPDGLPNLLVKDIPPRSEVSELQIDRPEIYYGELTSPPAVVNTLEEEFDYPSGDQNVYTRYQGRGGVRLESLWRKLVFGWRLDGTRFFLSAYPREDARVMFHRQVRDRVQTLAPFLVLDEDPYLVIAEGRLYWIIDAYTTSDYYPYSEPFRAREIIEYRNSGAPQRISAQPASALRRVNYARNAVKVVVDAYQGSVDLFVFDTEDALIRAWRRVFPRLFKQAEQMPAALRSHVRYPTTFLLAQGMVYAKYHMEDPEVFYNQEDLWVRATEKYHAELQPVEPYYVMWKLPGSDRAEFVLILPFTPKNRQVMIGWIAGLCDAENYGRFLAYKFPKERRVLGPQQVETKIDQDRYLSGQLTLWDQRGSQVIRGNVLAIPLQDALLYLEPIYLQAETAAYPELRLVVAMHADNMSYGETFEEALDGLFDGAGLAPIAPAPASLAEQARRAERAFQSYLRLQAEGDFQAAARELEIVRDSLRRLAESE